MEFTPDEMEAIINKAQALVLDEIENKVKTNLSFNMGDSTVISKESLLADIKDMRLEIGLS